MELMGPPPWTADSDPSTEVCAICGFTARSAEPAPGRERIHREFLDKLMDHGEIDPSLLTDDPELADRINVHPGLLWKATNVRSFRGRKGGT
jgi:hypothetical protein